MVHSMNQKPEQINIPVGTGLEEDGRIWIQFGTVRYHFNSTAAKEIADHFYRYITALGHRRKEN